METEPVAELIRRWMPSGLVAHVQLNDRNRRGPGEGADRFAPVIRALARNALRGLGGHGTVPIPPGRPDLRRALHRLCERICIEATGMTDGDATRGEARSGRALRARREAAAAVPLRRHHHDRGDAGGGAGARSRSPTAAAASASRPRRWRRNGSTRIPAYVRRRRMSSSCARRSTSR